MKPMSEYGGIAKYVAGAAAKVASTGMILASVMSSPALGQEQQNYSNLAGSQPQAGMMLASNTAGPTIDTIVGSDGVGSGAKPREPAVDYAALALATAGLSKSNPSEAYQMLEPHLDSNTGYAAIYNNAAHALARMGRMDEATALINEAIEVAQQNPTSNETSADIHQNASFIYMKQGDFAESARQMELSNDFAPHDRKMQIASSLRGRIR